jgi:hypothetical protein
MTKPTGTVLPSLIQTVAEVQGFDYSKFQKPNGEAEWFTTVRTEAEQEQRRNAYAMLKATDESHRARVLKLNGIPATQFTTVYSGKTKSFAVVRLGEVRKQSKASKKYAVSQ